MKNVRILKRTSLYGTFDHGIYGALEKKTDHLSQSDDKPRQILWKIYAKHCVLASGAVERSIVFPNNDRPGIMLSGAVRTYAIGLDPLLEKRLLYLQITMMDGKRLMTYLISE